eukprot:gene1529-1924_t
MADTLTENNNYNTTIKSSITTTTSDESLSKTTTTSSTSASTTTTSSNTTTKITTTIHSTSAIQNLVDQIIETFILIGYGVKDSLQLMRAIRIVLHSKSLQRLFFNCVFLNANSKWYTEIASESFRKSGYKNTGPPTSVNRLLSSIVDEIYRNLMFGVFLVISVIIAFIPYTSFINFVLVTWLYSFWCFDYKWILRGKWTLMQRLTYFESHWAYMFGYGALFTMASFFFPLLIGNAIFALLYPLFIILAVGAKPMKMKQNKGILPVQIPIFFVSEKIVNILLKMFVLKKDQSNTSTTSTTPSSSK